MIVKERASGRFSTMRMKLAGSRPWNDVSGLEPTGGVSNYIHRGEAKNTLANIPNYARLKAAGIYSGVDLVLYSNGGDLEFDFVVAPGADPMQIQLAYEGIRGIRVDDRVGNLILTTAGGSELKQARPRVYQQIENKRVEVATGYKLLPQGRVTFTLASYDRQRSLVIDPIVGFTQFVGGSDDDEASATAVDSDRNTYITGATHSADFPLLNAMDSSYQECDPDPENPFPLPGGGFCTAGDGFVTKLSPDGTILFSTYFGTGGGNGIAVDSTGVVVSGRIFPGSHTFTFGLDDGYVLKLSLTGEEIFTTGYGGEDTDVVTSVAIDSQHAAWVSGFTRSKNFGGPGGPPFGSLGQYDLFVAKLSPTGTDLFTRRWGGKDDDAAEAIAVDPADQPWITGYTCSTDFPTTGGLNHSVGRCGVFVMQLSRAGNVQMSTVFGGSDLGDSGTGIVTNGNHDAYVAGYTNSANFPTTLGAFQTTRTSTQEAFVTEITSLGNIAHSTLLGADDGDTSGDAIASDADKSSLGGVYVAGITTSSHLPGAPSITPNPSAGFVSKFSHDLSLLHRTTLLGAAVNGIAAQMESTNPFTIPVPVVYAVGGRYTGRDLSNLDAFVVKLVEQTGGNKL
jgi:Beta-propeller repeat